MKLVVWMVSGVLALGIAVTATGWSLPIAHHASRAAMINASPERVYALISEVEQYPSWWSDIMRVELLPPENGRARFRQHDSSGAIVMEVVEATPPVRRVTRIADPDQPFGGTWTWELARDDDRTRVTITERGEIYNPLFRFIARFALGYTATLEKHLLALEARARREN